MTPWEHYQRAEKLLDEIEVLAGDSAAASALMAWALQLQAAAVHAQLAAIPE